MENIIENTNQSQPVVIDASAPPEKKSSVTLILIIVIFVLFLSITGILAFNYTNSHKIKPSLPQSQTIPSVNTVNQDQKTNAVVPSLSEFTEIKRGHLNKGQAVSVDIVADNTGSSIFYINWNGGKPSLTLTQPDGQLIDKEYAIKNPKLVQFNDSNGGGVVASNLSYSVNPTQTGTWKVNIVASDPTDYQAFSMIESSLTLSAIMDDTAYTIGKNAIITATLKSPKPIEQTNIIATISRPDSKVDSVNLVDQGNGTYSGTYTIPSVSGYLQIEITAKGQSDGKQFTRQTNLLSMVNSQKAKFTGIYSEKPIDKNGDGLYDYLDFNFEIESQTKASYSISVELYSGSKNITQRGDFFDLVPGKQTLTLSFYGNDILESKLDGPYTVTRVFMLDMATGITTEAKDNVLNTSNYKYTQFKTLK